MNKILTVTFNHFILLSLCLITLFFLSIGYAETAEQKPPIKLGMSASMTGGAAASGQSMKLGLQVYFDRINHAGGIQGRKIEFIAMDDGYEPLRAAANLHKLIDKDQVLAIIGNNGTPAAVVAAPIVTESKIILFGARTGSALLRKKPPDRYIFNVRASHADEVEALIKGVLGSGIKPENIAFFSQNDAFGDSIYQGGMKALAKEGFTGGDRLPYGRYDRNTLDVAAAFARIVEQAKVPVKAFILGGVYAPNAQFIKLAKSEYPDAIFLAVSGLINPNDLTKDLEGRVFVSQVVPYPDSNLPAVIEYREDLKKYGGGAQPSFGSLEGYLVAKLFVMGLEKAALSNKLNREGIVDVFESLNAVDVGIGIDITYNKNDHIGLTNIWLSVFKDGKFERTNWPKTKEKVEH